MVLKRIIFKIDSQNVLVAVCKLGSLQVFY